MSVQTQRKTTRRRRTPRRRNLTIRLNEYERWVLDELSRLRSETRSALLRSLIVGEGQRSGHTTMVYAQLIGVPVPGYQTAMVVPVASNGTL
ncbi:MAG: hypothetical protein EOM24_17780 [Chloroflexia bacterium]|nr:hypothetical protein [Chloroflexia bacterium]